MLFAGSRQNYTMQIIAGMIGSLWLLASQLLHMLFHPLYTVALFGEILFSFLTHLAHPWCKLFWLCFNLYITLCSRLLLLTTKLLLMPVWILTARQREKVLEAQVHVLQMCQIESEQRNRELERRLELAINHCKRVNRVLEAESEQKIVIEKYQLLQQRVVELEKQNAALRAQERILKGGKNYMSLQKCIGPCLGGEMPFPEFQSMEMPPVVNEEAMQEGRGVALSPSMFSVFLSLLVGIITWKARDPCIPLVLALFMVVCISLKAIVQFFLSIGSRQGSNAVALLSFNWFILGTLVYPALPNISQTVAPTTTKFGHWLYGLGRVHHTA